MTGYSFPIRLRAARNRAGLSQERLAAKVGVSGPTIRNWERRNRRPRLANLIALAQALNVPTDWLAGQSGDTQWDVPTDEDLLAAACEIDGLASQVDRIAAESEALGDDA